MEIKQWQTQRREFEAAGVILPTFDVAAAKLAGKTAPTWLHFGGGNLYRAFHAVVAQDLLEQGELKAGVVTCGAHNPEMAEKAYHHFNNDFLQVVMHSDGQLVTRLIAATAHSLYTLPGTKGYAEAEAYFKNPALQFITVTITEKGYALTKADGTYLPLVAEDIEQGPTKAKHTMSIMTALLWARFQAGATPIAMVSTDNFSQNGKQFRQQIVTIAKAWQQQGFVTADFVNYVSDERQVSFPWSMIDRITPNPSPEVAQYLKAKGIEDVELIHTGGGTNIAGFANTEVVHYLVIEDSFPNGRPDLGKAGVILTDRETVDKVDRMKVTTCLNPLHTALAVAGCLLGYERISDEMKDSELVKLIRHIGYEEGLPVVADPKILSPKQFIDEVVEQRLPNPFIPDKPQRIACDTSQKIPIRFGETIKSYAALERTQALTFIPLAIALWLRYLLGVTDEGQSFEPSPDPLLTELQQQVGLLSVGVTDSALIHKAVAPILQNDRIFGCDLYKVGLGERIEGYLQEVLAGPQAVRKTLQRYV